MKILVCSNNDEFIKEINKSSITYKNIDSDKIYKNAEFLFFKNENDLSNMLDESIDACIIEIPLLNSDKYFQHIKSKNSFTLNIAMGPLDKLNINSNHIDIYVPYKRVDDFSNLKSLFALIFNMIKNHNKKYEITKNIFNKTTEIIKFDNYNYDPFTRTLSDKETKICRLSQKSGAILETLSINFGSIVKTEMILERVWKKTDYFTKRSMDVYVSHLRNIIKKNDMSVSIKNISGAGLILEKK